jgi:hypothetical protein
LHTDIWIRSQQSQLAGAGYRFGASLDLQFVKDDPGVSFDGAQGEEKPLTDLTIREPFGNEPQNFQLALTQRLNERLTGWLA